MRKVVVTDNQPEPQSLDNDAKYRRRLLYFIALVAKAWESFSFVVNKSCATLSYDIQFITTSLALEGSLFSASEVGDNWLKLS